jgi:hypothetical protein
LTGVNEERWEGVIIPDFVEPWVERVFVVEPEFFLELDLLFDIVIFMLLSIPYYNDHSIIQLSVQVEKKIHHELAS